MIIFNEERFWNVNGWGCRIFINDMIASCSDDPEALRKLEQAVHLPGFSMHRLSATLAERMLDLIERVAESSLSPTPALALRWRKAMHTKDQSLYVNGVRELLDLTKGVRAERDVAGDKQRPD